MVLTARSSCFVSISALSQYSELDCEENKLEVKQFDKQKQWKINLQQLRHCYSMQDEQPVSRRYNLDNKNRVLRGKICTVIVQYCFIIKTYTGSYDMEPNILIYAFLYILIYFR